MKIGLSRWIRRQPPLQPKSKLGGIPLTWLLAVPLVIQGGLLLAGVGFLVYRNRDQALEQMTVRLLEQASDRVEGFLGRTLEIPHRINRANLQAIELGILPGPDSPDPMAVERYFQNQISQFTSVSSISMGNDRGGMAGAGYYRGALAVFSTEGFAAGPYDGALVQEDGMERVLIAPRFDARTRPWYLVAQQARAARWTPIYEYISIEPTLGISATLPILSESGSLEGVLTADLNLNRLNQFLETARPTERSHLYILERSGLVVASSEQIPLFEPQNGSDQLIRVAAIDSPDPLLSQSAQFVLSQVGAFDQVGSFLSWSTRLDRSGDPNGDEPHGLAVFSIQDPYGLDWLVLMGIPEADLLPGLAFDGRWIVGLLELGLLLVVGYGLWLSHLIRQTLRSLSASAQLVANGILEPELPDSSIAEVKALTDSFRQMLLSLQEAEALRQDYTGALEQQVAQQTAALTEAQQIAQTGSWEYDLTTGQSRWSAQLYRIYEADPNQPVADPGTEITRIHPDDLEHYQQAVLAPAQALRPFATDLRILTQKGNVRHIFAKGQPMLNEQGSVARLVGIVTDITERKQAEIALAESQARFQRISDSSPAVIYILISHPDGSLSFEHISRAVEAIYGVTPEQVLAQPDLLYNQIHPDDRTAHTAAIQHSLATLDPFIHEWRIVDESGVIKWVKSTAQPQPQPNGTVAWYGVTLNVTRRKQTEDKLSRILDSSLDGIIQFRALRDPQDRIIDFVYEICNPAACRLLKSTEADLVGARLLERFPGIQSLTLVERWIEVVKTGQSFRQDLYYDDDELRAWFEISAVKLGDGIVITFRDISQLKQAQNRLTQLNQDLNKRVEERTDALRIQMEQEMILRNIVQSIHSSLDFELVLDTLLQETHRILSADHLLVYQWQPERDPDYAHCVMESARSNKTLAQFSRLSAGWQPLFETKPDASSSPGLDPLGTYRWFGDVLAICDRDRIQLQDLSFSQLIRLINQLPVRSALMAPIKPDGILWGWLAVYRYTPANWQGWEMKLLQQLSLQAAIACRQSQLYAAAQQQVQELEKLNQLKDDFLSTVSHELRTPMSNIKMAISLLEMNLSQQGLLTEDPQSRLGRHFTILKQESQREIQLINDLLEFSRIEAGVDPISSQPIEVPSFLESLTLSFQERTRQNQQQLDLKLTAPLPILHTHPPYLTRILQELLQNACKYTPPGESIILEVEAEDGLMQFSVTNTGVEIPASQQARIFERFYRITGSDRWKHGGTGLGLALVKELVQRLGGSIAVASQPGWTQFMLKLPLNPASGQSDN